ncbi:acyltransferase family protein [Herbiconiux liukaitaii]|uniref:acyltransferase family protein n=1 Tax=Herbiconiux liukaitaii TaxID=3342799 RepID=UPI0035B86B40
MITTTSLMRLESLNGLRAFAVFLVFWHHATNRFEDLHSSGMVGVSLFYLISGFVMAWTDQRPDSASIFYRKRFARIYPAYLVTCLLSFAWILINGDFRIEDLAALTLLQSWVPIPEVYFAAQAIFWSLSVEVFFYLAFPLVRMLTRRLDQRGLFILGGAAAAVSIGLGAVGTLVPAATAQWAFVVFPPVRLPEFVIGVVLGTLVAKGWRPAISPWLSIPLAGASVVFALFMPYPFGHYPVTLIPFAILIVSLAVVDLTGKRVFMQWPWIVKLGVWSYCIYLTHGLVLGVCDAIAGRLDIPAIVVVTVAVPLTICAAWLLHTTVERPAEKWLRPTRKPRLDDDVLTRS